MVDNLDDVWIVMPVYNEATVIADVVDEVLAKFPNVVCVDDGSRDASAAQVALTKAHLVRHPVNLGQGAALQTGLRYALARPGGRYFVTLDADGQHRIADVVSMLAVARGEGVDAVLGSRFLGDGQPVGPLKRLVLRVAATMSPAARRLGLTDAHNGLRVLSRPVAENLHIHQNRMAHASELVAALASGGWRVREVPVTVLYTDYSRAKGQSLVNGVNIVFDLLMSGRGR